MEALLQLIDVGETLEHIALGSADGALIAVDGHG
jgi:hypothetical protein